MTTEHTMTQTAGLTIFAWFAGLTFFNWRIDTPEVPMWAHALLVIGGMFAASIVIGGGVSLLTAAFNRIAFGRADASLRAFQWTGLASPVLAFIASKYALLATQSIFA